MSIHDGSKNVKLRQTMGKKNREIGGLRAQVASLQERVKELEPVVEGGVPGTCKHGWTLECQTTAGCSGGYLSQTPPDLPSAAVEKSRIDNVIIAAQSVIQGENEGHHKNAKAMYIRTLRTALDNYDALERKS